MEGLTKQQLILLALLVSFVTSLATGIVTVSLVNQAPPALTQTINRVVEKTIERVVTEPARQSAAVVTRETIVVKADDLVIAAIEKNAKTVVRIKEVTGVGGERTEAFGGLGLILSKEGLIAADIKIAYRQDDVLGNSISESYLGVFSDGTALPLDIAFADKDSGLLFFKPLATSSAPLTFAQPTFGTAALKLGQTVVAIGGALTNTVSTGIIANIGAQSVVRTDIRSDDVVSGSIFFNLSGEVIGINAGTLIRTPQMFLPIEQVQALLTKAATSSPSSQ